MLNPVPPPAPPAQAALAHSQALVSRIRQVIADDGGWIDFARYMDLALYAPGLGYYTGGAHKLGAQGDFVTAPELTALFSATLARQFAELVAITDGDIVELGAGTGRMAHDVLTALAQAGPLPRHYRILEVSADLRERQRALLSTLPSALYARVEWLDALPDVIDGAVIANEVLDALPVHLVAWVEDGAVMERGVILQDDGFAWAERRLVKPDLAARLASLRIEPPYVSEVCMAAPALVRTLAQRLRRGALLFIDYGFGQREYYHPQRRQGTLMCHYRHRAHDDPFYLPGLQDITAHVDFTAAAMAGVDAGLELRGYVNQASFLVNLGITDLMRGDPASGAFAREAAGVQKLLSPAEMGELFKVLALGRGVGALAGFSHGDLSRLL